MAKFVFDLKHKMTRAKPETGARSDAPVQGPVVDPGAVPIATNSKDVVRIGGLIAQRYRLDALLGKGGMGAVYRAHDMLLDHDVAIKIYSPLEPSPGPRADLMREAHAAAQLHHPNIVTIYETGTVDIGAQQPSPFIVMEFVDGPSLSGVHGLAFAQIIDLARQICDALEHAHNQGLVHRDLKPENILLEPSGFRYIAKLVDFGLARPRGASGLTENGIVGSVYYVAPEVLVGGPIDVGADLYSLGVVLYEMITGRVPFSDFDQETILTQHLSEVAVPPSHSRADVPPALEAIILRLLAKNPKDRFASARELGNALERIALGSERRLTAHSNLPHLLSQFVGREQELVQVKRLLSSSRLLTLTGSGGLGKTRLALAAGHALTDQFSDGIWLIELAPWSDPGLVPQAVATVFGIGEESHRSLAVSLTDYLREKNLVLLLDHCEHLLGACAQLAGSILGSCPSVRIVAISREPLNIPDEAVYQVPPLSLPDPSEFSASGATLVIAPTRSEGVRMLTERIRTYSPAFTMSDRNAYLLARVCQGLRGIPLALELAAAGVKTLPPEQLVEELAKQFSPPAGQDSPNVPYEETLHTVMDWAYGLLSESERVLFNRLSVFVGGWTLEAAESYCGTGFLDVMSLLTQLARKSLVVTDPSSGGELRYRIPETIRQYALDKLHSSDDEQTILRNHRDGYLHLAVEAEPNLHSAEQGVWFKRLETEYANLLAALDWTVRRPGDIEMALRFASAFWPFWNGRAYWSEGYERLKKILAFRHMPAQPPARTQVLIGAGYLAIRQGDYTNAREWLEQSLALASDAQDQRSVAYSLCGLGSIAQAEGDYSGAGTFYRDGWAEFSATGDQWGMANALLNLGALKQYEEDYPGAHRLLQSSLDAFRKLGDKRNIAHVLGNLGLVAYYRRQYSEARGFFEEGLAIWRELYDRIEIATYLKLLGYVALQQGRFDRARDLLVESLVMLKELNHRRRMVDVLFGLAGATRARGKPECAAKLLGAADALLDAPGTPFEKDDQAGLAKTLVMDDAHPDAETWQTARSSGRAMNLEQIVACVVEDT